MKSNLVVKPTWVETGPRDGRATERCAAVLTECDEIGPAIFRLRSTLERPVEFHEGQQAVTDLETSSGGATRCPTGRTQPRSNSS